jgi:hypothetical protein
MFGLGRSWAAAARSNSDNRSAYNNGFSVTTFTLASENEEPDLYETCNANLDRPHDTPLSTKVGTKFRLKVAVDQSV